MMLLGVTNAWGQTDYSGTYYIAHFGANKYDPEDPTNTDNHYWCPVDCSGTWKAWFDFYPDDDEENDTKADTYTKTEDTGMEFLTTYRFKKDTEYDSQNALWVITKHETIANAYYIQHRASEKYLTLNGYMFGTTGTGQNRLRIHLQSAKASDNKSVFTIRKSNSYFLICPLSLDGKQWINVSTDASDVDKQNKDANSLIGTDTKGGVSGLNVGGTLGYYSSGDGDNNSKWYLEKAKCTTPNISFSNATSTVTITAPDDETIFYTTDGNNPDANFVEYDGAFALTEGSIIKAITKKDHLIDSEITTLTVEKLTTPTITFNEETREATITAAEGVEIYYNTDDTDPTIDESTAHAISPIIIAHALPSTKIHAQAVKSGCIHSDVAVKTDIPVNVLTNPTIILTEDDIVYDGSAKEPTITVMDDDVVVSTDEYEVLYSNNTNAGTATITVSNQEGGDYQVNGSKDFTISPKSIGDGNLFADGITLELTPTGELTAVKDGSTTLTEDTDFTCEVTMDGADRMVTITGIGNYTGSANGIYANPTFKDPDGSVSEKAAAVYQAKRDMAYPSGIKPYIVKKVNPTIGTMNIAPLDYIPEGVPVFLLSDAEAEGFVASPKEESTPEITDAVRNSNQLKMAPEGGVAVKDREVYMFYLGEFVLAFEGTIKKGNFYLMNPNYSDSPSSNNAASRRTLQFIIEDVETGIENSQSSTLNALLSNEWFTLDGRRLNGKPAQKGLYIVNGQKVVIK